ncbi:MAG: ribosomal protein S18-alanine N-acetyltransferase [Ruminococcus sp.]|nr:ribosomal protein S18-alanine N-acetyltransferase [Ruminococcus sp.]
MTIQRLSQDHTKAIHRVEESCFQSPWSENTIEALLKSDNAQCFGCFENDTLVGYIALEWVLDEGSLTNLAVLPSYRRRGIAEKLTEALLEEAIKKDLQFVTLEVRVSNTPASNLYRKMGFDEVGVRKGYYSNPREDALLMTKYLA